MNKMTICGIVSLAAMIGTAAQAEPMSFDMLSFHQDAVSHPAAPSANIAALGTGKYRPYHSRISSTDTIVETEIAAFEEVREKNVYQRPQRSDRNI